MAIVDPDLLGKGGCPSNWAIYTSEGDWEPAPHLLYLEDHVLPFLLGQTPERFLLIQAPPRHGKTEFVTKRCSEFYLGRYPRRKVGLAAYEAGIAQDLNQQARENFAQYGPSVYGVGVSRKKRSRKEWHTTEGGGMFAAGVGGPFTGKGFHLLTLDDPIKNHEQAMSAKYREWCWQWFLSVALTRLEHNGRLIAMHTRWHRDDLIGRIKTRLGQVVPIKTITLRAVAAMNEVDPLGRQPGQALWPEKFPVSRLREIREAYRIGEGLHWWQSLYMQNPGSIASQEFPYEYFHEGIWASESEWPSRFDWTALASDPSKGRQDKSGDMMANVFVGYKAGKYWVDCEIDRWPLSVLIRNLLNFWSVYGAEAIGIEAVQFQELIIPELEAMAERESLPLPPVYPLETGGVAKAIRIRRLNKYLSLGKLKFRNTEGCRTLVNQLIDFPNGDYDDGPDALEMALRTILIQFNARSEMESNQ